MRVRNRVTMATAQAPGDQKVYQMICDRLTVKVTVLNSGKKLPGGGGGAIIIIGIDYGKFR